MAATTLYDEAAAAVASSGDSDGLLPILLASAYCLIRQRHWEDALGVLQRCRVLTRTWNDELGVLLAESMILNAMCRWDEADESYEKCLAHLPPGSQSVAARQRICTHRGVMTFRLGQYHVCKKWLQKSLAYGAEASPFGYCSALANTAGCAMLLGEYDRAANVAEDCHRIIRAKGYAFLEPWWMLCQGIIAEGAFNYHEAAKCFKEARNVAAKYGTPDDRFWADVRLGDVRRHEGDAESALEHHRTALDKVRGNRFGMFEQLMTQLSVGADLALIKDRGAGKAISEATALARKYGFLASLSLGLLYLGWLQIQNGRTEDGANTLREAMWIAEENGHIHFFAQESSVAMPILALCDRLGAGSSFIRTALVPRLPAALQTYFAKLTEADTDPATMPLGRPRPRRRKQSEITAAAAEKAALEPIQSLTEREREILSMLSQGLANKAIASSLSITEGTVKTHVNHILKKLGVTNRFQAILVFREHN